MAQSSERDLTLAVCDMADRLRDDNTQLVAALEACREFMPVDALACLDGIINSAKRNASAAEISISAARYGVPSERAA